MDEPRDFEAPEYKAFRFHVFARDQFTCQMCHCKNKTLNAHHIQRWADAPNLRFISSNGISLCTDCHEMVTDNEAAYELEFKKIVKKNLIAKYGPKKTTNAKGKYRIRNPRLRY